MNTRVNQLALPCALLSLSTAIGCGAAKFNNIALASIAGLPSVAFTSATSSGAESSTTVNLSVALDAASASTVTVNYAVTGGSATGGGTDYTLASGTLTFTAGQTSKNIVLSVVDDTLDEVDETVIVGLSSPTNATLGAQSSHTYTILDNDCTTSSSSMTVSVNSNADDGEIYDTDLMLDGEGSGTTHFGSWGGLPVWAYWRFALTSAIPADAIITSASLRIRMIGSDTNNPWNPADTLTIFAENSSNAAPMASYADYPGGSRTSTSATVAWVPGAIPNNTDVNTADLKTIVQELVTNHSGLANGAYVLFHSARMTDGTNHEIMIEDYSNAATNHTQLTIQWDACN